MTERLYKVIKAYTYGIDLNATVIGTFGRREQIDGQGNAVGAVTLYNAGWLTVVRLWVETPRVYNTHEALVEVNLYLHQSWLANSGDRWLEIRVQYQ